MQMLQVRGATAKAKGKAKGPLEVARPKPKPLAKEPVATTVEVAKVAAKEEAPAAAQKPPPEKKARPPTEPVPAEPPVTKKAKAGDLFADIPTPPPVPEPRVPPPPPPKPEGFVSWSPAPPPKPAVLRFNAFPPPPAKAQDKICCMSRMLTFVLRKHDSAGREEIPVWLTGLVCMHEDWLCTHEFDGCMHGL